MTDEIRPGIAGPGGDAAPRDRIFLRDYVVEVEIGAFAQERGRRQRVRFEVAAEVAPAADPLDDDVDRILSYDRLVEAIEAELRAGRINLLETLAERVARRILARPLAERVRLRIEKIDRGPYALGVEIVRAKSAEAPARPQVPRPRVVHLANSAAASGYLAGWLDALGAEEAPPILTVGAADLPVPHSAAEPSRRRIALLAIEQNAWVLAGRDPRARVVGTWTELDWAMRHGQISVWAPSKIVLDAAEESPPDPGDALQLSAWLAESMEAVEFVVVGAQAPVCDLDVRSVPVAPEW